jgi:mono/diheme cytochrome c family protein
MQGPVNRIICISLILLFSSQAFAISSGITGYSGNPASAGAGAFCSLCHNSGLAPVVAISGPTSVAPGSINGYQFTINDSPQLVGGFNASASSGNLLVPAGNTRIKKIGEELTHTQPAAITGAVSWNFEWQAPSAPGIYTLYVAGVAADSDHTAAGDHAAIDGLTITVAPQGPVPTAVISAPLTATPNSSVSFDGSKSTAPAGATVNRYDWSVDGVDFPNAGPGHIASFSSLGWHRVTLTVTDSVNASATTFADIVIVDATIPAVDLGGPYSGEAGAVINFDASGSVSDSTTTLTNFIWDFGDGSAVEQGSSPTRSHSYANQGDFIVTVAAQDGNNMSGVAAVAVSIASSTPQPTTGEEIYNLQCSVCHGPAGSGTPAVPKVIEGATRQQILDAIVNVPEMNAVTISSADAQLVADYLVVSGSSGEAIYRGRCQICHGVDGVGIAGTAPPVKGSTREMILNKIASVPSMNGILLDSSESQLVADFLGITSATTGSGIYTARCAICHGSAGTGIAGVGPSVRGATQSMIASAISSFPIMDGIILPSGDAQLVADYLGSGGTTGQDFYINKCEICHGASGLGGSAPFVKGATRYMILGEISRVTDMNGILVSTQQAQQIADYLGSGGATGQDLYTNRCLICHGQNGGGTSGPYDGENIRGKDASQYLKAIDDKKEMQGILLNSTEAQAIQNYLNGGGG